MLATEPGAPDAQTWPDGPTVFIVYYQLSKVLYVYCTNFILRQIKVYSFKHSLFGCG
jgi:hypothetical protein